MDEQKDNREKIADRAMRNLQELHDLTLQQSRAILESLIEPLMEEAVTQERERILGLMKDVVHFTGADSPSGANVWFRMKDTDYQALREEK